MSLKALDKYRKVAEEINSELSVVGLFSKTYSSRGDVEKLVFDGAKAFEFATSQNLPDSYEYWTGLKEQHFSEKLTLKEKMRDDKNQKKIYSKLSEELEDVLFNEIKKNLSKKNLDVGAADIIFEDFAQIVEKKAFRKEPHPWAEGMYRIYMNGGWPCGWEGNYPSGHLLIFTIR
jgi:signal recognition particle GTPase